MSVIAAEEFENFRSIGCGSGESDGAHDGFGPAVDETDEVDGGECVYDDFGELCFGFAAGAETEALVCGLLNGLDDFGVCVSDDCRPPCSDEVDVLVAIDVGDVCTLCGFEEDGVATDAAERSDGAVDATGHDGGSAFEGGL